jgi:hypothetical protein
VGLCHDAQHRLDELPRYILVEQIAHGVNEDHAGLSPLQGLLKSLLSELEVKSAFVWVTGYAPKALCKSLRVAVSAPRADL